MKITSKQMKKEIEKFFKASFIVDGKVKIISKKGFKIENVIELNDSVRGKFYIGYLTK